MRLAEAIAEIACGIAGACTNSTTLDRYGHTTPKHVRKRQALPEWSTISQQLDVSAMELANLTREWQRYRAVALDAGNEAINVLRDKIRSELEKHAGGSDTLDELVDEIYLEVKDLAQANISPFSNLMAWFTGRREQMNNICFWPIALVCALQRDVRSGR